MADQHEWTVQQLKIHLEGLIAANERRRNDIETYNKEALKTALQANDKRLDQMNEFRAALTDQSNRMITRVESEAARHVIADKAEEATRNVQVKLDSELRPLRAKLEEMGKPNWALMASAASVLFVLIAGTYSVMGLKINEALGPSAIDIEAIKIQNAIESQEVSQVRLASATSTNADSISRGDREQLNVRLRAAEEAISVGTTERRAAVAANTEKLVEIETQFNGMSDALNFQKDATQQWLGLLWQRVYNEPLPQTVFRPNTYKN